jgi:hypothetical protein
VGRFLRFASCGTWCSRGAAAMTPKAAPPKVACGPLDQAAARLYAAGEEERQALTKELEALPRQDWETVVLGIAQILVRDVAGLMTAVAAEKLMQATVWGKILSDNPSDVTDLLGRVCTDGAWHRAFMDVVPQAIVFDHPVPPTLLKLYFLFVLRGRLKPPRKRQDKQRRDYWIAKIVAVIVEDFRITATRRETARNRDKRQSACSIVALALRSHAPGISLDEAGVEEIWGRYCKSPTRWAERDDALELQKWTNALSRVPSSTSALSSVAAAAAAAAKSPRPKI